MKWLLRVCIIQRRRKTGRSEYLVTLASWRWLQLPVQSQEGAAVVHRRLLRLRCDLRPLRVRHGRLLPPVSADTGRDHRRRAGTVLGWVHHRARRAQAAWTSKLLTWVTSAAVHVVNFPLTYWRHDSKLLKSAVRRRLPLFDNCSKRSFYIQKIKCFF